MKEIRALTTLRALAALLVFLYHYEALYVDEAREAGRALWDPLVSVWRSGAVAAFIVGTAMGAGRGASEPWRVATPAPLFGWGAG